MLLGGLAVGIDVGLVEVNIALWLGRALLYVVEKNLLDQDTISLLPVLDNTSLFCEDSNLRGVLDLIGRNIGEGKLDGSVDGGGSHVLRGLDVLVDPLGVVVFQNTSVVGPALVRVDEGSKVLLGISNNVDDGTKSGLDPLGDDAPDDSEEEGLVDDEDGTDETDVVVLNEVEAVARKSGVELASVQVGVVDQNGELFATWGTMGESTFDHVDEGTNNVQELHGGGLEPADAKNQDWATLLVGHAWGNLEHSSLEDIGNGFGADGVNTELLSPSEGLNVESRGSFDVPLLSVQVSKEGLAVGLNDDFSVFTELSTELLDGISLGSIQLSSRGNSNVLVEILQPVVGLVGAASLEEPSLASERRNTGGVQVQGKSRNLLELNLVVSASNLGLATINVESIKGLKSASGI